MDDQNPWAVENIKAFSFYCCPECDFKSKDGNYFKRHAMESHNQSKVFFIMSNSENNINEDHLKVETDSDYHDENQEGMEDLIVSEHKAQKLVNRPDLETFYDSETADYFEDNLKTFDEFYDNITDAETSDKELFDGIDLEMKTYGDYDIEKTNTFSKEIFKNEEVVTKYFVDTDVKKENFIEIENQKIQENLLPEKFGQAMSENLKKKSISSKTREWKTNKELPLDLKISIIKVKGKKSFKCNICEYSCSEKSNMNKHIRAVHEGKGKSKCKICNKIFFSKSNMIYHMKSVHEGKKAKKAFNCGICDKIFSQKGNLKTHVASFHEGKKAFKCDICHSRFGKKDYLKRHVTTVHEGKKQYKCDICYAQFALKHGMNGHIKTIHEGEK